MEFHMKEIGFRSQLEYGELNVASDEAHGFRPYQLMVASIAVCSGGVLRKILEKKRLNIADLTIQTEAERNEKEANRIETISLHYVIKGEGLDRTKIAKAIELAHKHCSMAQSVKDSITISETFEIQEIS